jgi:hypothetical protein
MLYLATATIKRVKTEKNKLKLEDTTILGYCRAFAVFRILTYSTRAIMLLSMKVYLRK